MIPEHMGQSSGQGEGSLSEGEKRFKETFHTTKYLYRTPPGN